MTQWGLDTLFNPSKRHMDEEKQRLQSTREEVGDNSGGRRIDFEAGRVTIRKGDGAAEPEDGEAPQANAEPQRSQRPQSDAQRRAAERRAAKRRAGRPAQHPEEPDA